jgi:hypothetical protein
MFTTAGVTCSSIGASDGIGWPSTAAGRAAAGLVPGTRPMTIAASRPVSQCGRRERRGDMESSLG